MMPEEVNRSYKPPLDEQTLNAVKREFDKRKKETPYKKLSITKFVDSGSFAKVYKAESRCPRKVYAIRIADDQGEKTQREIEAVRKLMELEQDHIVNYLMTFPVDTQFGRKLCTLMDFLCPLSAYSNKADDIEIAVRCGVDLLPLLQVCMDNNILHRDIKPQNILYNSDFRNAQGLLLSDFGEARIDCNGTVTGRGTLATMAPEIYFHKEKHDLCDMYSLGIVMYYYLNGRVYPYDNDHKKRLNSQEPLPEPKYCSRRLKNLVIKATMPSPRDRFASPKEMLQELQQCDEYKKIILHEVDSNCITIDPNESIIDIKVGKIIKFGQYPQGAQGEIQPLEWRVLAVENGMALLITDKLIDYVCYNESYTSVTWETSTMRMWMNNDFIRKAFSSGEQKQIATVTNRNPNNPEHGTKGGSTTKDRIFALNIDEAENYFLSDSDRKAYTTDYVHKNGTDRSALWWLRSPGNYDRSAVDINNNGHIHQYGQNVCNNVVAVRPAFWLNLKKPK